MIRWAARARGSTSVEPPAPPGTYPWVFIGWIAAQTSRIALGTASFVLPLRHRLHTAKFDQRQEALPEHLRLLRQALSEDVPVLASSYGEIRGVDLLPKPFGRELPVLVTGSSGQSPDWIAREGHGWLTYPRPPLRQRQVMAEWHDAVEAVAPGMFKPFAQSLYIDLTADPDHPRRPIHLGGGWAGVSWLSSWKT